MKWRDIVKKYPKAFAMLCNAWMNQGEFLEDYVDYKYSMIMGDVNGDLHVTFHDGSSGAIFFRDLYNFFDDLGYYVEICPPLGIKNPLNKWSWNIYTYHDGEYKHDGGLTIDRNESEFQSFEAAFKLLEENGI